MSKTRPDVPQAKSAEAEADPVRSLFQHEVRRDGRVVVKLHAHQTATTVTVESEVFPVTQAAGEPGITRPFAFSSLDHAHRFADETLLALEYLGCTIT